jgi:hypothetical protein
MQKTATLLVREPGQDQATYDAWVQSNPHARVLESKIRGGTVTILYETDEQ